MNRRFQEARDFAGADWENLKPESRDRLLEVNRLPIYLKDVPWKNLPPTAKATLAESLMGKNNAR